MMYELANAQHQGSREEQQDAAAFTSPDDHSIRHAGVLGVLSDGMGGLSYGSSAARLAVSAFLAGYKKKDQAETIPDALLRALIEANSAVLEFAQMKGRAGSSAATLVGAVLKGNELYWISAGDSRAYLLRGGALFRLTVDHTFGEDALNESGLTRANATVLPRQTTDAAPVDAEAVSSFMGYPGTPRTDRNYRPLRVDMEDCILLASDGLYRALSDNEIVAAIKNDLRGDCEKLVQLALRKGVEDQDNITVMAMRRRPPRQSTESNQLPVLAAPVQGR